LRTIAATGWSAVGADQPETGPLAAVGAEVRNIDDGVRFTEARAADSRGYVDSAKVSRNGDDK
jgi:hypothetical protein